MVTTIPLANTTRFVLESLARFDTLKTERLAIVGGNPAFKDPPYRAFLPMKSLRSLALYQCESPQFFIHALDPSTDSSTHLVVCSRMEELVLTLHVNMEEFDIQSVGRSGGSEGVERGKTQVR